MLGELGILNVGAGDTKLSFDPTKPAEVKRAGKVVKDMLKRGFAIFVEVGQDESGPLYRRATDFDEKTAEYLIVGVPDDEEEASEQNARVAPKGKGKTEPDSNGRQRGRGARSRVPAAKAQGVAVARIAGG